MPLFLYALAASAVLVLLTVRIAHRHDAALPAPRPGHPQHFHVHPAPRLGGVAIYCSLILVTPLLWREIGPEAGGMAAALLVCGLPAFGAGLLEDLTHRVRPRWRLLATAAAAMLAVPLLDATIARTDLWGFDALAALPLGAAFLAVFTVAGIANAVNIIDGFNGLAAMCVMMMLLAMAYVAGEVGDTTIAALALVGVGAVLGFFLWNYPAGLIFLGDGGAYFMGFYVAELGILLLHRNPAVSPLFPLLMVIYPVFETLFSMYRRRIVRGHAVGIPDGVHLHSLIYRRLLRWAVGQNDAAALTRRNAATAPYLWLLCMLAVVPSVLFWHSSRMLGGFILLFGVSYVLLYGSIVRFRAPRWLVRR